MTKRIQYKLRNGFKKVKRAIQISLASIALLGGYIMKMPISGDMLAKAFISSKSELSNRIKRNMVEALKQSSEIQSAITTTIWEVPNKEISSVIFTNFSDKDLHNSIGNVRLEITGKNRGTFWDINVKLQDKYDFDKIKWGLSFSNIMNNIGLSLQKLKLLEVYEWELEFDIKTWN